MKVDVFQMESDQFNHKTFNCVFFGMNIKKIVIGMNNLKVQKNRN